MDAGQGYSGPELMALLGPVGGYAPDGLLCWTVVLAGRDGTGRVLCGPWPTSDVATAMLRLGLETVTASRSGISAAELETWFAEPGEPLVTVAGRVADRVPGPVRQLLAVAGIAAAVACGLWLGLRYAAVTGKG
jgi:hypothetical protein